jgi:hypothetical protein
LTCGTAFAIVLLFFALQYQDINVNWWGDCKSLSFIMVNPQIAKPGVALDDEGGAWFPIPSGGFGPAPGEFH